MVQREFSVQRDGEKPHSTCRPLSAADSAHLFEIRDLARQHLGVLVAVAPAKEQSAADSISVIETLLRPALEQIARELTAYHALSRMKRDLAARNAELDFMYTVSARGGSGDQSLENLGPLAESCVEGLSLNLALISIPERRIRIVRESPTDPTDGSEVLGRVENDLFEKISTNNKPLTVKVDDDGKACKVLACPIREKGKRVTGMLVLVKDGGSGDFSDNGKRLMYVVAGRIGRTVDASYDPLTRLMNRELFERKVEAVHQRAKNDDGAHCLLYIDFDRLHVVNDTFGHQAGDEVLLRFASLVTQHLREPDIFARLSGDHFSVLMEDTSQEEAQGVAEEVRAAVNKLDYLRGDQSLKLSVSIGVSEIKADDPHPLTAAKAACKAATEHGGNRIEIYDDGDTSIRRRYSDIYLVTDIRNALDRGRLRLLAQPIVPLTAKATEPHYELLVRMTDDEGRERLPREFIPAAERYQMMPDIDRWVVRHAYEFLSSHIDMLAKRRVIFSINLSGQSLSDASLLQFIMGEFDAAKVPPNLLCFEITETAAVANLKMAKEFIDALRLYGCRFSLDDFGAGLSSFAYLKSLPVDFLKIDGSFVRDIRENRTSEAMVVAIHHVAKIMGLETIAEFVEDDATRERLHELGVDYAQGFGITKPFPLEELPERLPAAKKRPGGPLIELTLKPFKGLPH